MTVIKINAITVPEEAGDELAQRFAARAGAVDGQEGFEGFELLRPTDDRRQWLVVTRWRDDETKRVRTRWAVAVRAGLVPHVKGGDEIIVTNADRVMFYVLKARRANARVIRRPA